MNKNYNKTQFTRLIKTSVLISLKIFRNMLEKLLEQSFYYLKSSLKMIKPSIESEETLLILGFYGK